VVSARGFPKRLEGSLDFRRRVVLVNDCDSKALGTGREGIRSFSAMLFKQADTRLMISFVGSVSGHGFELLKRERQEAALQLNVVGSPE
jgi:hypothetical protein